MRESIKFIILSFIVVNSACDFSSEIDDLSYDVEKLCIINSDGTNYTELSDYEGHATKYYVNADSQILFVHNNAYLDYQFTLMDRDGSNVQRIQSEYNIGKTAISPGHNKIAFRGTINSVSDIHLMNYDGSNIEKITESNISGIGDLAFSNDGNYIVFTSLDPDIQYINILTGEVKTVPTNIPEEYTSDISFHYPKFGKDDNIVFYIYSYGSITKALYSSSLEELDVNLIENDLDFSYNYTVSSTSELIAFSSRHQFNIIDYNGLYKHTYETSSYSNFITISSDGSLIVIGDSYTGSNYNILIFNTIDFVQTVIAEGSFPVISSDGTKVCFNKTITIK